MVGQPLLVHTLTVSDGLMYYNARYYDTVIFRPIVHHPGTIINKLTGEFTEADDWHVLFCLVARVNHNGGKRHSIVTNVNGIASELANVAKISDGRFEKLLDDSAWEITLMQAARIGTLVKEWATSAKSPERLAG